MKQPFINASLGFQAFLSQTVHLCVVLLSGGEGGLRSLNPPPDLDLKIQLLWQREAGGTKCLVAVVSSLKLITSPIQKQVFFLPKNGHEELSSNPSIFSSFDPRVDGGVKGEEIGEEARWFLVQIHNIFRSSKVF